ncbi:hypothetical protein C5C37_02125 [Rathayibacter sp. AY1F9]|nr:hypothetical protein C5C37_02125 [Rathayibacter sp. AY1F9]
MTRGGVVGAGLPALWFAMEALIDSTSALGPSNQGTVGRIAARLPEDIITARPILRPFLGVGRFASSATSRISSRFNALVVERTPLFMLAEVVSRS